MRRSTLAVLVAGLAVAPAAALAQYGSRIHTYPGAVVTYADPGPQPGVPQAGVSYWCSNPQGWYPSVRTCSMQWVGYKTVQPQARIYSQTPTAAYVVTPVPAPSVIIVERPAYQRNTAYDSVASAVYYVGPSYNAPYQSGIAP
jgi:hypothetical protein